MSRFSTGSTPKLCVSPLKGFQFASSASQKRSGGAARAVTGLKHSCVALSAVSPRSARRLSIAVATWQANSVLHPALFLQHFCYAKVVGRGRPCGDRIDFATLRLSPFAALSSARTGSHPALFLQHFCYAKVVGVTGFEPAASSSRTNRLSAPRIFLICLC